MELLFIGLLGTCALEDWKRKQISMKLLGALLAGGLVLLLQKQSGENILGGLGIGIAIFILAHITRSVGAADGILVCATGLVLGFWLNLALVSAAVFAAALYGMILLISHRKSGKDEIAFAPFLFLSYVWVVCCVR